MNCNTCNDTKKVYNESWDTFHNCPDCNVVHAAPLPSIPAPDILILHCSRVSIAGSTEGDPPIMAQIIDIDYDDVLRQVPISEAVRYYGVHNLLANMDITDIKEYLEL